MCHFLPLKTQTAFPTETITCQESKGNQQQIWMGIINNGAGITKSQSFRNWKRLRLLQESMRFNVRRLWSSIVFADEGRSESLLREAQKTVFVNIFQSKRSGPCFQRQMDLLCVGCKNRITCVCWICVTVLIIFEIQDKHLSLNLNKSLKRISCMSGFFKDKLWVWTFCELQCATVTYVSENIIA